MSQDTIHDTITLILALGGIFLALAFIGLLIEHWPIVVVGLIAAGVYRLVKKD